MSIVHAASIDAAISLTLDERYAAMEQHRHWSSHDEGNEMARFNRLHEIVAASNAFDAVEAERVLLSLEALAHSYGYGCADSHLSAIDGKTPDEIEDDPHLAAQVESYESYQENDDYFSNIAQSERILRQAATTEPAGAFVLRIGTRMDAAFLKGRACREHQKGHTGDAR